MQVLAILYEAKDGAKNPQLLSCVENELGLREFLEEKGVEYVVTADKDGENSEMEKHLEDATIFISTPFHPGYLTKYAGPFIDNFCGALHHREASAEHVQVFEMPLKVLHTSALLL